MVIIKCVDFECDYGIVQKFYDMDAKTWVATNSYVDQTTKYLFDEKVSAVDVPKNCTGNFKVYLQAWDKAESRDNTVRMSCQPFCERYGKIDVNSKLSPEQQVAKLLNILPKMQILKQTKVKREQYVEFSDCAHPEIDGIKNDEAFKIEDRDIEDLEVPNWCKRISFFDICYKHVLADVGGRPVKLFFESNQQDCKNYFIGKFKEFDVKLNRVAAKTEDGQPIFCERDELIDPRNIVNGKVTQWGLQEFLCWKLK